MIRRLLVAATVLTATVAGVPRTATALTGEDPVRAALDKAFAAATGGADGPGVQAVAMRNGKVIWSAKTGRAIDDPPAPVTGTTMFSLASFGKSVLATYALHLVEKGKLALDTPISAYTGKKVAGSGVVTLRMLLTHTAGYPDVYADPRVAPLFPPGKQYKPDRPYTFAMLAPGIRKPVKPGTSYAYSNTGFILLAHVLTKVSGGEKALERDLATFYRKTGERGDHLTAERSKSAYPRFAHGYAEESNGALTDYFTAFGATGIPTDVYGLPFGDGLFAGTAYGAARYLDALFVGKRLLRPATLTAMTTPTPQAVAAGETYGMATYRTEIAKRTWQGHAGAYGGFTSMGATDLTRGVTLTVVTNRLATTGNAQTTWENLARAYATATS
ncbi:serine hydrolase domain-containing protein [Nonomuraea typhae]|uniref:serine hydrolase domain-containing protein n=1 Tax=Nonomuraea typhae TaxID=2603600 RepID=UPI0012FAD459|nr:serine hydrolase domain-containing protein [Nonomuraea typhae]